MRPGETKGRSVTVKVLGVFKAATDTRDVPAGTVIFEEGSTGEEMFGVVEGKVELRLPTDGSITIGPDETFGEMALVDESVRSATATALEDSQAGGHRQAPFLFLVGETPTFALQVMASLAERLRAMQLGEGAAEPSGASGEPDGLGRPALHHRVGEFARSPRSRCARVPVGQEPGRVEAGADAGGCSRRDEGARLEREGRGQVLDHVARSRRSCRPCSSPDAARR